MKLDRTKIISDLEVILEKQYKKELYTYEYSDYCYGPYEEYKASVEEKMSKIREDIEYLINTYKMYEYVIENCGDKGIVAVANEKLSTWKFYEEMNNIIKCLDCVFYDYEFVETTKENREEWESKVLYEYIIPF